MRLSTIFTITATSLALRAVSVSAVPLAVDNSDTFLFPHTNALNVRGTGDDLESDGLLHAGHPAIQRRLQPASHYLYPRNPSLQGQQRKTTSGTNASSSMGIIQAHSLVTGEPEIHRLPGDPNYYTPSNGKLIYHPSNDALKNPTLMSDGNSYYRSKSSGKQVVHPNSLTGSTVDFNGQRWLVANSKPTSSNRASPPGRADSYGDDRAKQQPAPGVEFRNFRGETYKYTTSGELVRVSGQRYTGL